MKRRWLILLAIVVFAWTLAMHAPAANLVAWFMPANAPVQIYGVQGTLRAGSVAALRYDERPIIEKLQWKLRPWWLLTGRVALRVDGGTGDPRVHGVVKLTHSTLQASNLVVDAELKTLLAMAGYAFLPVDSLVHLEVHEAGVSRTGITALDADLAIRSLRWDLGQKPVELGNFAAHATRTAQGGVEVKLASTSGPIDASGQAMLDADGHYALDLALKARPDAPAQVVNLLHTLGRPDATGTYHVRSHGQAPWPAVKHKPG